MTSVRRYHFLKRNITNKLILLLAAVLLLGTFSFAFSGKALAASGLDPSIPCSLTVHIPEEYVDELKDLAEKVTLYRIASVSADVQFTLLSPFDDVSGLDVTDLSTAEKLEQVAALTAEAVKTAKADGKELEKYEIEIPAGAVKATNDNLPSGLYLMLADAIVTDDSSYSAMPFAIVLPQTGDGFWQYLVASYLKIEKDNKLSKIIITKSLDNWYDINEGYDTKDVNTVFIFDVVARVGDRVVYSDVLTMNFKGPGTKSLEIDGLPIGATVTVKEVYSGGEYELKTGDKEQTLEVKGPALNEDEEEFTDWTTFRFGNTLNRHLITSGGVVNYFEKAGEGWKGWVPVEGNEGTIHARPEAESAD